MCPSRVEARAVARLPARRLNARERARLVGEILGCYVRVRVLLRSRQIEAALGSLRAPLTTREAGPGSVDEARRLGRLVARTLAPLPGDTRCLVRSLVLTRLLATRGISSTLVIGARTAPEFLAHAWVEHDGVAVLDSGGGEFPRLVEL
jgi:Transglutaminase-like superfamily